jgi:hypothetical protein
MRWRAAATILLALAIVVAAAPPARAAEDPREVHARALYARGEYQAALDIYADLFAEKGDPLYLRNIGRCNQKLQRPDKAIDAFRDYLTRARKVKPAERAEVEGYIHEMEQLKAQQAADERARAEQAERERPRPTVIETTPQPPAAETETRPVRAVPDALPPRDDAEADARARRQPGGGGDQERRAAEARGDTGQRGTFFLVLAVGSGFGFASGHGELNVAHRLQQPGFAPAQLGHVAPEIGVFVTRRLLLSAQLRLQYISFVTGEYLTDVCGSGERYCQPSALGLAAFGRLAYLTGDGGVHFIAGLAAGGGNIRHAQEFAADGQCGPTRSITCVDTLASGPFLFGPSIGLLIELGDTLGLITTVNTQVGVPQFTLNFDANLGISFRM